MFSRLSIVALILSSACLMICHGMEVTTYDKIALQIRAMISSDKSLFGGLVRLAFHDCVGDKCDGCINENNPENAGLKRYIDIIDGLFNGLEVDGTPVTMSRADFWAMCGREAAIFASEKNRSSTPVVIGFRTGRIDCLTSPTTNVNHTFPSALGDTTHVLNFFRSQFGFNTRESVAILGAHTLGMAHRQASGFIRPWVPQKDRLDNQFYVRLRNVSDKWAQRSLGRNEDRKFFWQNDARKLLMLNADMSLIKDFGTVGSQGQVSCSYRDCPDPSQGTADIVDEFADDNRLWVSEFGMAFSKMIEHGYSDSDLKALVPETTLPLPPTTSNDCTNNVMSGEARSMDVKTTDKKELRGRYSVNNEVKFHGVGSYEVKCNTSGILIKKRLTGGKSRVRKVRLALYGRSQDGKDMSHEETFFQYKAVAKFVDNTDRTYVAKFRSDGEWERKEDLIENNNVVIRMITITLSCNYRNDNPRRKSDKRANVYFDELAVLAGENCVIP